MSKVFIVPDIQAKPGQDFAFLTAIGKELVEQKPDLIVNLGDTYDFPSLSSYDSNRKCEGRRLQDDLDAGDEAMVALLTPLWDLQGRQRANKKKVWQPRMVFLMGNHEHRLQRHIDMNPVLEGAITPVQDHIETFGWEVYDFKEVFHYEKIVMSHYFYAPMTGRPYGGMAATKLKNIGASFLMGHQQGLDYAMLTRPNGYRHHGLVMGSCYIHEEEYIGAQAQHHWRGIAVLNNVKSGQYDPTFISTTSLMEKYL